MKAFLIGMAIGMIGVIAMWIGGILRMHENPDVADDAKFLLAVGVGIFLAGCAFSTAASIAYDDGHFQPKPTKMEIASRSIHAIPVAEKQ